MKDSTVYSIITERIVALLEQGTVPWQKPWSGAEQAPQNLISRKPYRGVNVFLLHSMSYASPFWLTFKQAQELGGHVRKGEKACPVVFWKWLDKESGERDDKGKAKADRIPLLRYYSVFNVAQCDGIPESRIPALSGSTRQHEPIDQAERIAANMPSRPAIQHGGAWACYWPSFDRVDMPEASAFRSGEDYYSVLFHELTHATGHESRLARKGVAGSDGEWSAFGSTPYAKEELVAEMGSAFLCGQAGIVERTIDQSAAYVANWLQRLRDDNRLIVTAAAQAQKAADFILGVKHGGESEAAQ
jgi:antirestriction protein ArdC